MKKYVIAIITTVITVGIMLVGCAGGGPVQPPEEPEGKFLQPNPLWGIGIQPDGQPYRFEHVSPFMGHEFMVVINGSMQTILERSGAQLSMTDAQANLESQQAAFEDALVKKPDGIFISVLDAPPFEVFMERAAQSGIPIYEYDHCTFGPNITSSVTHDHYRIGQVAGEWLLNYANETGKDLHVYEIWAMYSQEGIQKRHRGIHSIIGEAPNITVLESPDTESRSEIAQDAVLDAFPTHPELNAIVCHYNMTIGITEALRTLGMLYPVGHPEHIPICTCNEVPAVLDHMKEGWVDVTIAHSPWEEGDAVAKVALWHSCLGEAVPKEIIMDTYMIPPDKVHEARWGATEHWGYMLMQEPNFDKWPILDCPYIETPTAK